MPDIGPESTAAAWAIARNLEQSSSFSEQQTKYRKGIVAGGGNDVSEDGELPKPVNDTITLDTGIDSLPFDENSNDEEYTPDNVVDPFIINISGEKGIYLKYFNGGDPDDLNNYRYVHFYLDNYKYRGWFSGLVDYYPINYTLDKNYPCIDIMDGSGSVLSTQRGTITAYSSEHLVHYSGRVSSNNYRFITKYQIITTPYRGRIHFYQNHLDFVDPKQDAEYWDTYNFLYWDLSGYTYVNAKTSYP